MSEHNPQEGAEALGQMKMRRRDFLKRGAVLASGVGAFAAALSPLKQMETAFNPDEFVQKHYKEMTPEEMAKVLKRIEHEVKERYGVDATVRDIKPMDGVEYMYALNLSKCNGSRKCVHACVNENNQSRSPEIQYITVLKMPQGTFHMEEGEVLYDPPKVPEEGYFYMPVQCHQCKNPPCVKVCPVQATWQESDGITVIDYDWCIGCRYCEAACPYWARRFNFAQPKVPKDRLNPDMAYLSNRPRANGVMEKCTFCLHRTRQGRYPACLEACPTGARVFGNILDPDSAIAHVFRNKRVYVLKEEIGTVPRFFYYFDT